MCGVERGMVVVGGGGGGEGFKCSLYKDKFVKTVESAFQGERKYCISVHL